MKKILQNLLTVLIIIQLSSCNNDRKETNTTNDKNVTNVIIEKDTINYNREFELKEAFSKNLISITANGLGTYTGLEIFILNKTKNDLFLNIISGLFFENPDSSSQSLLTCKKIGNIKINQRDSFKIIVPTVCTNVHLKVPSILKNWKFVENYKGGIDEILEFYGNHELAINTWLKKKNPEKFETEKQRQLFLQVVIWLSEDAKYNEILDMLKKDVYKEDIEEAKAWLDSIYNDAQEITKFIKNKDSESLKKWCENSLKKLLQKWNNLKKNII